MPVFFCLMHSTSTAPPRAIQEFNQVIAPSPIRVAMSVSHMHASMSRTVRLELIEKEVNSPAPHMGLSLGQPIQVPSDFA